MEVFIHRIPPHCTERDLTRFFSEPLAEFDITNFVCEKFRSRPCAKLVFLEVDKGNRFLARYGRINGQRRPIVQLRMNGMDINCAVSRNEPDEYVLRSLEFRAMQSTTLAQSHPAARTQASFIFDISHLRCGVWSFVNEELTFVSHFDDTRPGKIWFGHRALALTYDDNSQSAYRIYIKYFDVDTATTGGYRSPTITFALNASPSFYCKPSANIEEAFARLGLSSVFGPDLLNQNKKRVTSINEAHAEVVSTCFVYQVQLADRRQLPEVFYLLQNNRHIASTANRQTPVVASSVSLTSAFEKLDNSLVTDTSYKTWPFDVKFQLLRLARNGVLSPDQVLEILPTVSLLQENHDVPVIVEALRHLCLSLPPIGPHSEPDTYSLPTIANNLLGYAQIYDNSRSQNPYELVNRHAHIVLVHKLNVRPTGVYLQGPEPEVSNRVLRDYKDHCDCFLRVTFTDEDGESVHYDGQSDQKGIYAHFKSFMESEYSIAGRKFSFLGFSHSSLRSQTCWFMAPFEFDGTDITASKLIKDLGDFGHIRVPARCAARIGQAFTDTTGTVEVEAGVRGGLRDVERNGRCFSDGCGTISLGLLRKVWGKYGSRRTLKPVILQIRFAGVKGVVSLDSRLVEDQFNIRPSMEKFTGSRSVTLEVCGAAWRPYPMVLNRQFIKILEDLNVPLESFMMLQDRAVEKLRMMTTNTFNASFLLNGTQTSKAARLSGLLEMLSDIGLEYHDDSFLRGVVEMAVITKLRDIKYRGRIPVENGITLYGIMDETGFLQEGQIYVVTQSSIDERKQVLTGGRVIITRSPALHPGDIRTVEAIDVPENSPLNHLRNCVVFSQHGCRDLPSKLRKELSSQDPWNMLITYSL